MTPLPKRRNSTGRAGRRHLGHNRVDGNLITLVACAGCGANKKPHFACPNCGKK